MKSRKIFISFLEKSELFSVFDKNSSFDRLFPNQDSLSGKGFGNLIALPLYKPAWELGNSCFIDVDKFESFADQWKFLEIIQKVSIPQLDYLYTSIVSPPKQTLESLPDKQSPSGKLLIRFDNSVRINRAGIPPSLVSFLKDELNFVNTEYLVKKKMGKNPWGIKQYFKCIDETTTDVITPRGMIGKLLRYCKENKIEYEFQDERQKMSPVSFSCDIQLREYQKPAIETTKKKDVGIIVAPPGTGKTVIALKIIADKQQPALIVVHRKQLADQWIERIETFLGIPKNEIGRLGQGKGKSSAKITIAMIQSLKKELTKPDSHFFKAFGTIIIDECHHVPAETYNSTISQLHTYYIYGLTATPFRKYNDGKLIFIHLGEVIAELKSQEVKLHKSARIIIQNTELDVPFNPKTDRFETLSKVLVHDSARNMLIIKDLVENINAGKKAVILTER